MRLGLLVLPPVLLIFPPFVLRSSNRGIVHCEILNVFSCILDTKVLHPLCTPASHRLRELQKGPEFILHAGTERSIENNNTSYHGLAGKGVDFIEARVDLRWVSAFRLGLLLLILRLVLPMLLLLLLSLLLLLAFEVA